LLVPISPQPQQNWTGPFWIGCDIVNIGSVIQNIIVSGEKVTTSPYLPFTVSSSLTVTPLATINISLATNQSYSLIYTSNGTVTNAPSTFVSGVPRVIKITISEDRGAVMGQCVYEVRDRLMAISLNGGKPF